MATIAVIGSNGILAQPTIDALTTGFASNVSFPITVVTRSVKDKVSSDKVKYVEAELNEENLDKLYGIFKGIDVIIELANPNPQLFATVEKIVERIKPKLVIPTQFGIDQDETGKYLPDFIVSKTVHTDNLRKTAGVKVVDVPTSLFAVPGTFLYEWVGAVGANPEEKTVTYFGDPDFKFGISKAIDVGNTVAFLSTVSSYSSLPEKVRVYSDLVSQKEVVTRYEKTHGVKFKVNPTVSKEDALIDAKERFSKGFDMKDFFFYLQVIIAQGDNKGLAFTDDNERELVNPKESLWKWDKF